MAGINYVELHSADSKRAQSFYAKLFDWKFESVAMPGPEYLMHSGQNGDGNIGLTAADAAPMWLPYVTVANVAASVKHAASLGGKVLKERTEIPAGIFAIVADPTGLPVALWEKKN